MMRTTASIHERRFLEGAPNAARALYLDSVKVHALDMPFKGVEIREKPAGAGAMRLAFTGYASVAEVPYQLEDWLGTYTEIIRSGAFTKTLNENPDVAFLLNHGGATMARTKPGSLRLSEDSTGLLAEADLDPARPDVQIVRSGIEGGELDEMSFAFWATRETWSPDYTQRDILEVGLNKGDVSVVNYGANDATGGLVALRARQVANLARSRFPAVVNAALQQRSGVTLSANMVGSLMQVLGLVAVADEAVDEAQVVLAELLGVPNPDVDAPADDEPDEIQANGLSLGLADARRRALTL